MKSLYLLTALAAFNLVAAQKTINLESFKSLTTGEDMKVKLVKSNENKLVVANNDEDEEVTVENVGGLLILRGDDSNVTLYYKDNLEAIIAGEDSVISGNDEIKANEFKLVAGADAIVHLNLNVQKLFTVASDDAVVTLTGKATDHNAVLKDDAVLKGTDLLTVNTVIKLSADAVATITTKGTVNAEAGEDASLKIFGNPKTVNKSTGEDGSIVVVN
ncbi:hypothetical protein Q765_14355 [Flavobacterium rivuli WB 3.3-2 = DSM 21788]|uniref:Putative auto-transporter adhesin head GIN domain-containing protein n=1 Tax=Flavobacterium rivuli WB 3.3-2 = DSM 21788 TaxID=1121895 RepID=A0A0A2M0L4_9FLAO|nr:DUF2807 domain-containing protein [Flavobacterium rivuli]KGO85804.1 hypothetical protein Q765_14355 [Flavobacterium rivuli WB 3.3-2 = DSM 21788]